MLECSKMYSWAYLFLVTIVQINALPFQRDDSKCGYDSCNPVKEGFINVHLVPHTHDDVGWLKTVDQYYYGAKNDIQRAGVQYILGTVMDSLARNPSRRFMYIETAFIWRWWKELDEEQKDLVRNFIDSGRLELTGGGWSMNDEGAANYQSIIDQMTWGLRKLNDTFGECGRPRAGWQIDPFGHSKEMANIFALLGYDAFLLNRIDFQDFNHRRETKTLESIWRSSASAGPESDIFTVVLPKHYSPPPGFCFDVNCNDVPIIDDPSIPDYNVIQRVDDFIAFVDDMMVGQTTSNVLITMGDDFNYQDAEMWFTNLDKLIKYTNERQESGSKYNLLYSTASCYVKAVYDESKGVIKYPVKHDDFFPYAGEEHGFLTGYFTSRPTQKRFEREGNNLLQVCKQLSALTGVNPDTKLDSLREAMGVMQHHDAITGTEKQAVADDYARILALGFTRCEELAADALNNIANAETKRSSIEEGQFSTCRLLNISQCAITEAGDTFLVTVYNPLSRIVNKTVRLPVVGTQYSVRNSDGEELVNQLLPIPDPVLNIPGRESKAVNELVFRAINLPPLGFETFYVQRTEGYSVAQPSKSSVISERLGGTPNFQKFAYYEGFVSTAEDPSPSSGAYVFRPFGERKWINEDPLNTIYDGPIVTEIHQTFNEYVSQVFRIYNDEPYFVELNWLVGPIPDDGEHGKEIVSVFETGFNSNLTFFTDSNGREMIKRIKNYRPTWDVHLVEDVAANYYPVTSKIVVKDEENEFAILTDRAQGGSSINDGEIELMVHRTCLGYDVFGEALREQAFGKGIVARGTHFAIYSNLSTANSKSAVLQKDLAQRKLLDSWLFLSTTGGKSFDEVRADTVLKFAGLKRSLPENIHLLTLEPWKESTFLLRLEHVYENDEDPDLSQPVTVDLTDIFTTFQITSLKETTLGGNQWLNENKRLYFDEGDDLEKLKTSRSARHRTTNQNEKRTFTSRVAEDIDNLQITLNPMEIRTFVATVEWTS